MGWTETEEEIENLRMDMTKLMNSMDVLGQRIMNSMDVLGQRIVSLTSELKRLNEREERSTQAFTVMACDTNLSTEKKDL